MPLREDLRDARAHAAVPLVFFDGDDRAARPRGAHDRRFVHRLDRMIVHDRALDAVFSGDFFRGDQRVVDEDSACDDGDVPAFAKRLRLSDFKRRRLGRHDRRLLAPEAQIRRAPALGDRQRRLLGLHRVARNDDGHVRDHAHDRDILDGLVRRAVGADGDAGVRAGDLDVGFVQRHRRADLLPRATRIEHRVTGDERNLAGARESRRHRDE